jgi:hypothetical protein
VGDDGPYAFVGERRPEAGDVNEDVAGSGGTTSVRMSMDGILLVSSPGMLAVEKSEKSKSGSCSCKGAKPDSRLCSDLVRSTEVS